MDGTPADEVVGAAGEVPRVVSLVTGLLESYSMSSSSASYSLKGNARGVPMHG